MTRRRVRTATVSAADSECSVEQWHYQPADRPARCFDVQVFVDKPLDVAALKG